MESLVVAGYEFSEKVGKKIAENTKLLEILLKIKECGFVSLQHEQFIYQQSQDNTPGSFFVDYLNEGVESGYFEKVKIGNMVIFYDPEKTAIEI